MTPEKIIQIIPQQYMPSYSHTLIRIGIPYSIFFKPEEAIIEDKESTVEISIGGSHIRLFKRMFDASIGVFK